MNNTLSVYRSLLDDRLIFGLELQILFIKLIIKLTNSALEVDPKCWWSCNFCNFSRNICISFYKRSRSIPI